MYVCMYVCMYEEVAHLHDETGQPIQTSCRIVHKRNTITDYACV